MWIYLKWTRVCTMMNKNVQGLCARLKEEVIHLIDDLMEILPGETDIMAARMYFEFKSPEKIMEGFCKYVLPNNTRIMNRDESYFTQNDTIFGDLPKDKVRHFKNLFEPNNPQVTQDDKDVIWQYFEVFVKLAATYEKLI